MSENRNQLQQFDLILDQDRIARRIAEMGKQITSDYSDEPVLVVGVLKGSFVFLADLIRQIDLPLEVDFIASTPGEDTDPDEYELEFASGELPPIKGRHVLIVEGVVDTGRTVNLLLGKIRQLEPASAHIVTLLDKPGSHRGRVEVKYKGFTVGNEFVIGFGLDNAQKYRNLPFVGRMADR